jgi:acyl dehydratase
MDSPENSKRPAFALRIGDRIAKTVTLTASEVIAGAKFLGDENPLHNEPETAAGSRFGALIASGPHVGGLHACMLPTHCASLGLGVLGTYFTTRYLAPVLADVEHELAWIVTSVNAHKSGGHLVDWTGTISTFPPNPVTCVATTGQVLILSA